MSFEDLLDYTTFCLFVEASDSLKSGFLINLLRVKSKQVWTQMCKRLHEMPHHFQYQHPTKPNDAEMFHGKSLAASCPQWSYKSTVKEDIQWRTFSKSSMIMKKACNYKCLIFQCCSILFMELTVSIISKILYQYPRAYAVEITSFHALQKFSISIPKARIIKKYSVKVQNHVRKFISQRWGSIVSCTISFMTFRG